MIFKCPLTLNMRNTHNITENYLEMFFKDMNYVQTAPVLAVIDKLA